MKHRYITLLTGLLFVSVILISRFRESAMSSSLGAPAGHTGSPGDNNRTCAKAGCHSGVVNSGPGSISIDLSGIPSSGFLPGEDYTITVEVDEAGISRHGFSLTAENDLGHKQGTFTANAMVRIQSIFWVTQRSSTNSGIWTFNWTAPSDVSSKVTFYAAGNAANGNNASSGDHIYTISASAQRDITASAEDIAINDRSRLLMNPVYEQLIIESMKPLQYVLFDLQGRAIAEINAPSGRHVEDVSALPRGMFLLVSSDRTFAERVILR